MFTIVGLGNPGAAYENTRHNAGRIALCDLLVEYNFPDTHRSSEFVAEVTEGAVGEHAVRVAFPTTYMNASGGSVGKLRAAGAAPEEFIIAYDDLDLPLGSIRVSYGRGAGGHNGVESVIKALGTKNFTRIRVGIAPVSFFGTVKRPKGDRASAYVLGQFSKRERAKVEAAGKEVTKALETIVNEGVEKAMNQFN